MGFAGGMWDAGSHPIGDMKCRLHERLIPLEMQALIPFHALDVSHMLSACPDTEAVSFQVDFIWINRDQQHFEWFLDLLAVLELQQEEQEPGGERDVEHPTPQISSGYPGSILRHSRVPLPCPGRFLELHLYMTSALGRSDVKAVGLQLALDLLAAKEQKDSITGLRTRTQPGRPNWSQVRARALLGTASSGTDTAPSPSLAGVGQGGRGEEGQGARVLLWLAGLGQSGQSALRAFRLPLLQGELLKTIAILAAW